MSAASNINAPSNIHIVHVPGDGDCLFTCVSIALASVGRNYTAQQLRKLVASRTLDKNDEQFNYTLQTWCDLARAVALEKDELVKHEFAHIFYVAAKKPDVSKWTLHDRTQVFANMMSPQLYWGDEIAIDTLQRMLDIRFLIYDSVRRTAMKPMPTSHKTTKTQKKKKTSPFESPTFVVLELADSHYNLIGATVDTINYYIFPQAKCRLPKPILNEFAKYLKHHQ